MQCPTCGYNIADDQVQVCPSCGRTLGTSVPGFPPSSYPTTETAGAPSQPPQPGYPEYPSYAPPAQPTYPPSYGQPEAPSQGYPGYPYGYPPTYGQPAAPSQGAPSYPPGYGQPAAPSQGSAGYPPYGQPGAPSQGYPYGQPAVPSQGYPGYPYGYPPTYSQPMPGAPGMPGSEVTPRKRSNVGIIVSIVLAVVVVAGLLIAGVLALSQAQGNNTGNNPGGTSGVTNGTTPTPVSNNIFSDPLTTGNANGWSNDQHCFFGSDGYHIKGSWDCFAPTDIPNNFSAQVQIKQINGATSQGYGIFFRRTSTGNEYYFFIDGYGHWRIDKCVNSTCSALANWAPSGGALQSGLNKENTIEVDATGSHFTFFANGKQIGQINDGTFSSGNFGLAGGDNIEVVYTNLVINQIGG